MTELPTYLIVVVSGQLIANFGILMNFNTRLSKIEGQINLLIQKFLPEDL